MSSAGDTPIPGVPGVSGRHHSLDYRPSVGSRLRRVIRMPRAVDCSGFALGSSGISVLPTDSNITPKAARWVGHDRIPKSR